ncbi:MAG TPA: fumarylacetoacetate hydrolase family protein, partial [Kofleriaceae bacterium]|nr:fumarylacetoacetate hydrolase family protein [Kofleriaceae bacterium]
MLIRVCKTNDDTGRELDLTPTKVLGIGTNYRAHAVEMGKQVPDEPLIFLKPTSAVIAAGAAIVRPSGFTRVDY